MFALSVFILVFGGLGLKIYWDYTQDERAKRQCIIRDLENDKRLIDAGINPTTRQAFGQDHSHDYCNAYSPCPGCKEVADKNMQLNREAWARYNASAS